MEVRRISNIRIQEQQGAIIRNEEKGIKGSVANDGCSRAWRALIVDQRLEASYM